MLLRVILYLSGDNPHLFHLRCTLEQEIILMFVAAANIVYRCLLWKGLGVS